MNRAQAREIYDAFKAKVEHRTETDGVVDEELRLLVRGKNLNALLRHVSSNRGTTRQKIGETICILSTKFTGYMDERSEKAAKRERQNPDGSDYLGSLYPAA